VTRQPQIARRAEELLGTAVTATGPVAGGDTATATKLRLSNGTTALMKTLPHAPDDFFRAEARGLAWLGEATASGGVPVPGVLAVDDDCLIIAWVEPTKASLDAATAFGAALATTHAAGAPAFGAEQDGYIGRLPLPNRTAGTWAEFYAVRRVLPYLKLARDREAVTAREVTRVEAVIGRLTSLLPVEAPARLHGDLWNGNVLWGGDGQVWLIDPASYAGHRELDLAMLALFGMPHLPRVLEAYQDVSPLADGWEDRVALHQLFPLLAHAAMVGGGYGARAAALAARYA
jgi:fructosamine-3-kinase